MKIAVCMVQVPATDAKILLRPDARGIETKDIKFVISPYDEYAIEAGLQLKEKFGGEVVLITAGHERSLQAIREGLALGADRAVHIPITDEYHDGLYIASLLSAYLKKENADCILFGKLGVGFDHASTGPMTAAMLDLPHVGNVAKMDVEGTRVSAHREIEGATESYEIALPAVLTAEKGLNTPRFASLKGIMAAKKKPVETVKPEDLGAPAHALNLDALQPPPQKAHGKVVVVEDPAASAKDLVKFLREEAKVI